MVGIGGIGGSGTRVIAQILHDAGYFIGNDLNESNDNLLFTLLFKRENILTLTNKEFMYLWNIYIKITLQKDTLTNHEYDLVKSLSTSDRTLHSKEWLNDRLKNLNYPFKDIKKLAFKEPNSHIVIEKLIDLDKNIKFIYVYRNGLDMAYSNNQNQLKLWGGIFLNNQNLEITPKNSLKYWCLIHQRMLNLKDTYKNNIFMLNFDNLCQNTDSLLNELSIFLNNKDDLLVYKNIIKKPLSINRYLNYPLSNFDIKDLELINKYLTLSTRT